MISKNSLFLGQEFPDPERATTIYDAEGEPLYKCPYCGNVAGEDDCGVIGAELGNLFCNQCHREFET